MFMANMKYFPFLICALSALVALFWMEYYKKTNRKYIFEQFSLMDFGMIFQLIGGIIILTSSATSKEHELIL